MTPSSSFNSSMGYVAIIVTNTPSLLFLAGIANREQAIINSHIAAITPKLNKAKELVPFIMVNAKFYIKTFKSTYDLNGRWYTI